MIAFAETGGSRLPAITELEPLCASYNTECVKLEEMIASLENDLETVKQRHLRGLKKQAAVLATTEAELYNAVESSPKLFVKPRTTILHGTKIGYTSCVGSVIFEDAGQVVKLIERHFPNRFDELVKTEYTPRKDTLRTLSAEELTKLGCQVEGAGDLIVLKRVSGDVEKLINKLIEKLVTVMVTAK